MKMFLFIKSLLEGDLENVKYWGFAIGVMALLVIIASLIDLRWGIKASKACGEFSTTSYGLRKTVVKDESYLMFFFLGVMIDACLGFFLPMPVASIVVAVSEILIESVSVFENRNRAMKGAQNPMNVVKAVVKTFGITDAEKISALIEAVKAEQEKASGSEEREIAAP